MPVCMLKLTAQWPKSSLRMQIRERCTFDCAFWPRPTNRPSYSLIIQQQFQCFRPMFIWRSDNFTVLWTMGVNYQWCVCVCYLHTINDLFWHCANLSRALFIASFWLVASVTMRLPYVLHCKRYTLTVVYYIR